MHRRMSREDQSFTLCMLARIPWSQKGLLEELSWSRHEQITCKSTSLSFWYSLLLAGKQKQHFCPQHTQLFFICSKCSHLKPWFWLNSAFYNGAPTKIHCYLSSQQNQQKLYAVGIQRLSLIWYLKATIRSNISTEGIVQMLRKWHFPAQQGLSSKPAFAPTFWGS